MTKRVSSALSLGTIADEAVAKCAGDRREAVRPAVRSALGETECSTTMLAILELHVERLLAKARPATNEHVLCVGSGKAHKLVIGHATPEANARIFVTQCGWRFGQAEYQQALAPTVSDNFCGKCYPKVATSREELPRRRVIFWFLLFSKRC